MKQAIVRVQRTQRHLALQQRRTSIQKRDATEERRIFFSFSSLSVPAQDLPSALAPVSAPFLGPRQAFSRQDNVAAGTRLVEKPHMHQNRAQKKGACAQETSGAPRGARLTIVVDDRSRRQTTFAQKKNFFSYLHKLPSEVHGHERVGGQDAWGQGSQEEGGDGRQEERAKPRRERHFWFFFSLSLPLERASERCEEKKLFLFQPRLLLFFTSRERGPEPPSPNSSLSAHSFCLRDRGLIVSQGSGITHGFPFYGRKIGSERLHRVKGGENSATSSLAAAASFCDLEPRRATTSASNGGAGQRQAWLRRGRGRRRASSRLGRSVAALFVLLSQPPPPPLSSSSSSTLPGTTVCRKSLGVGLEVSPRSTACSPRAEGRRRRVTTTAATTTTTAEAAAALLLLLPLLPR